MTAPTGLEARTPVRLTETSVTERATFRQCRRRWLLSTVHRLEPPGGTVEFLVGELVHAGLAAYYLHPLPEGARRERSAGARQAGIDALNAAWAGEAERLESELGFLWPSAEPGWTEAADLARELLAHYFLWDEEEGGIGIPLHVEERWSVRIPGTRGRLRLRMDLVALLEGRRRRVGVVDNKTAAAMPSDDLLDMDDQFTGYAWSWRELTGEAPDEVIRNVLMKIAARPPAILKAGTPSRRKGQPTTHALYTATLRALKLDPAPYQEVLDDLRLAGRSKFFRRQRTRRTAGQLDEFGRVLALEWRDMRRVATHPEEAYPNVHALHCGRCPVRPICQAMLAGEDEVSVIQTGYQVGDPRP